MGRETDGKFHKTDEYVPRKSFLEAVPSRKGFLGYMHQTEKNGRRLTALHFCNVFDCNISASATFGLQFAFNCFRFVAAKLVCQAYSETKQPAKLVWRLQFRHEKNLSFPCFFAAVCFANERLLHAPAHGRGATKPPQSIRYHLLGHLQQCGSLVAAQLPGRQFCFSPHLGF